MTHVEPTGVLFVGICDIQTEKCTARTAAPITAVWSIPGREQINTCRACLDEMVRRGEWQIEGARLRRRADVAVFDTTGNLQLVIEAKQLNDMDQDPSRRAIQIRRNLLAHAGLPQTPFFLIAFPDHFYLWKQSFPDIYDRPADYSIDAQEIVQAYSKSYHLPNDQLTAREFETVISDWIKGLITTKNSSKLPNWIVSSGLYKAIKDGAAVLEATV